MSHEFFPPTEEELIDIIAELKKRLEDPKYEEDWIRLHDELMYRELQLKDIENFKN